jgi:hypothetical protein
VEEGEERERSLEEEEGLFRALAINEGAHEFTPAIKT